MCGVVRSLPNVEGKIRNEKVAHRRQVCRAVRRNALDAGPMLIDLSKPAAQAA